MYRLSYGMNILERESLRKLRKLPEGSMFLVIGIILLVLWIGGFFVFHVAGFFIHILLILAVISIIWNFFSGK